MKTPRSVVAAVAAAVAVLASSMSVVPAPLASGAEAVAVAPVDGAAGIGDPYWPLDGNGGIDVTSYRIVNRYAFDTGRLSGRTTIRLRALQDLSSFSLDFLLPVRSVAVDGRRAGFVKRGKGHELRITPSRVLPRGTAHRVVVRYAGRPAEHRYAGQRNWLADKREVVAMNEPHMAPWWFPANDHPSDKALVDVSVTVPRGKEVVANGRLVKRTVGRRLTRWRWRADEPMAPYLAFFAAGDFQVERGTRDGTPWLLAVSQQLPLPQRQASMRLMRKTPRIVGGLEQDLGDYPFSVSGGLTTALNPGFALENQTRPTYPAVGAYAEWLVVHELAHQWFGNHVAVQRWRDIWLNEGFATFMEWRWNERNGGRAAKAALRFAYDTNGRGSSLWSVEIGQPGPRDLFHFAVYERGAMTVQALRNRVGEQDFWRIVRTWLAEQGGRNGSSAQFEALAERVSGEDLQGFFEAWLRTASKPADTAHNGLR
ncbi:MAG: M1 family metallopeptidase [Nocardioides sp.]|nr:M1 family metallopeptidase [Nocardioides sp.]